MKIKKLNRIGKIFLIPCLMGALFVTRIGLADIVGGEEVQDRDPVRSSTVALYSPSTSGSGGALCTASLIGKDTALTAAHCIPRDGSKPILLFGDKLRSPDTLKRNITGVDVNHKWATHQGRGMDEGDVAVVKFSGGIPSGYQVASMDDNDSDIRKGGDVVLAGYGISNSTVKSGAGVLRKTQVKVASARKGKSEMIFDQTQGHGACHGDSGGPAFIRKNGKMILAGVTNRSYPSRAPDDCAHQVVYTKVSAYKDWIKKAENNLHSGGGGREFKISHRSSKRTVLRHEYRVSLQKKHTPPKRKSVFKHGRQMVH